MVLPAAAVQILALALHELTTNAVKHGSLAHGGELDVGWTVEGGRLTVAWTESGGAAPDTAAVPGFGLQLIRWMLPHELDARTDLGFTADGLACTIAIDVG